MSVSTAMGDRSRSAKFRLHTLGGVGALALVVCCVVPMFGGTHQAGADDVGDLNARANRIAQSLVDLQQRIGNLGEQFNQSQVRRDQLAEQKVDIERRSRAAGLQVSARRADAHRYALSAYIGADQGDTLSLALDGRQWELSRRSGYAAIRIGDRDQVVDDLQAAQDINNDLLASLSSATQAEQRVAADLERQEQQATKLIAQQEKLQSSVKGELAQAVARRQAAIEAAQAAQPPATTGVPGTTSATSSRPAGTGTTGGTATTPGRSSGTGTTRPGRTPGPTVPRSPGPTAPPSPSPTAPPPVVTPPPPVAPPSSGTKGPIAARAAVSQVGVRYSWGGGNASGPSYGFGPGAGIKGFDCSGLTLYAWAQAGVSLYHSAQMQYGYSAHVSLSQLQPGDLVFYGNSASSIDHVSIYVGNGQVVHAPNHTTVVQYGPVHLWPGYYAWIGAGRPG